MPDNNSASNTAQEINLTPFDNSRLALLCGQFDENIKQLETLLNVTINRRGNAFKARGADSETCKAALGIIRHLYRETENGEAVTPKMVSLFTQESADLLIKRSENIESVTIKTPRVQIKPRGDNQCKYVDAIKKHDINFGIGPAGTGKTYLAVACAVEALSNEEVKRILLRASTAQATAR